MGEYKLQHLIDNALKEDMGTGDITSQLLIPKNKGLKAVLLLKEKAIVAGLGIAEKVFKTTDRTIKFRPRCPDGSLQNAGKIIATLEGRARPILLAERTALNFLAHLCGIANLTHKFVQKVKPYKVKIMDTRKTLPGLRALEKYAVVLGGGYNHRMGLWDEVLIKDNHIAVSRYQGIKVSSIRELVEAAKKNKPKNMALEVEVKNLREFREALIARPDIIMLDNMNIENIKKAVAIRNKLSAIRYPLYPKLEVSGGVTLDNVREIAKTGVDMISIGGLTHSAKSADISLEITNTPSI